MKNNRFGQYPILSLQHSFRFHGIRDTNFSNMFKAGGSYSPFLSHDFNVHLNLYEYIKISKMKCYQHLTKEPNVKVQ